jgi:peptidoglycan hydrolase-like protein with peptidoglycan-binding domain
MTTQAKINWGLGIAAVIALYYLSQNKNPQIDTSALDNDLVLTLGSSGAEVAQLQTLLKQKYNANLGDYGENHDGIDGDFGTLTEIALRKYKGVGSTTLNQFNAS